MTLSFTWAPKYAHQFTRGIWFRRSRGTRYTAPWGFNLFFFGLWVSLSKGHVDV